MKNFLSLTFILCLSIMGIQQSYACQHTDTNALGNSPYCNGDQVTFTNNLTSSCFDPNLEYCFWTVEKEINGSFQVQSTHVQNNVNDFVHTFTSGGKYRVSFVTKDDVTHNTTRYPCFGGNCVAIIEVYDGPNSANFVVDDFDCNTNTITITTNAGYQYSQVSIDWGDGNTSGGWASYNPFSHTYASPLQTSYNITVTVDVYYGCNTGTYTYSQVYRPVPQIYWAQTEPNCDGFQVCQFNEINGLDYFQWFDSEGNPLTGQINSGCVHIPTSGDYTVYITSTDGCIAAETFTFTLPGPGNAGGLYSGDTHVDPLQPVNMSLVGNYDGTYVVYEMLISNCSGPAQWIPIGWGPLPATSNFTVSQGVMNSILPCMLNADFELCFRARTFCEDPRGDFYNTPSATTNTICLPLCVYRETGGGGGEDPHLATPEMPDEQRLIENQFKVFPNPTQDRFMLELHRSEVNQPNIQVQIMDVNGRTLMDYDFSFESGFLKEEIDLSNYPAGVYILKLEGEALNEKTMIIRQ